MNWFQVKMIKKGTKPPVWRRGFIPNGITFAQLAWILEEMLDCEKTDRYEFEFYHRKEYIGERREGERLNYNFFYSFLDAAGTFINERLEAEKWFTFRLDDGGMGQKIEFRIEREKIIEEIFVKREGKKVAANSPVISKEVGFAGSWSEANEKNAVLAEGYQLRYGEADYRPFQELLKDYESGNWGIRACRYPKDQTGNNVVSVSETLLNMMESTGFQPEKLLERMLRNRLDEKKDQESRSPIVKDMLLSYEKNDLTDIAKGLHLRCSRLKKEELAEKIANEILTPEVMKRRFLILEEEEITAFEAAMKRKCFYPTEQEWEDLEGIIGMDYIAYFRDKYIEVPEEVVQLYQKIATPEFHQERRKINWMMECLAMFGFLYVSAPARVAYEMYCRKKCFQVSYEEFLEIFEGIPEEVNPCTIVGEKMALSVILEKRLHKKVERMQRQVDYYIPTEDEIHDFTQNGYLSKEPCYGKLKGFFTRDMKMAEDEADYLCTIAYREFAKGKMLSDIMGIFNGNGMEFRSQKQVEKFASLMMGANNHTRMIELRGHMPAELAAADFPDSQFLDTKIVPMRNPLSCGPAGAQAKKVYPNDPCPCGSGKKYKKCCGKNRQV